MKKYLIFLLFPLLAGCTIFGEAIDQSSENVAKAIDAYCAETTQSVRDQMRASVNSKTAGHTIVITCNAE